jgi:hypothetical protein
MPPVRRACDSIGGVVIADPSALASRPDSHRDVQPMTFDWGGGRGHHCWASQDASISGLTAARMPKSLLGAKIMQHVALQALRGH